MVATEILLCFGPCKGCVISLFTLELRSISAEISSVSLFWIPIFLYKTQEKPLWLLGFLLSLSTMNYKVSNWPFNGFFGMGHAVSLQVDVYLFISLLSKGRRPPVGFNAFYLARKKNSSKVFFFFFLLLLLFFFFSGGSLKAFLSLFVLFQQVVRNLDLLKCKFKPSMNIL